MGENLGYRSYRILVAEPEPYAHALLELRKIGRVEARRANRRELLAKIKDFDALLVGVEVGVDKQLLDAAKKLKVVATATTGLNHVDVECAKRKGVKVISLQGAEFLKNVNATAEHTLALLLALVRKIPWAFDSVKCRQWTRKRFFGRELNGKTLGVIGFGRLGSKLAGYAHALGMRVLAFDPYVPARKMARRGARKVGLRELLRESDFVSVHVTLTPATIGLVGAREFAAMKPTAFFVNTSRGAVVDEKALLQALRKKKIAGAALDVLASEGKGNRNPLEGNPLVEYARSHDNLLITPHLGGATLESMALTTSFIAGEVKKALRA